MKIDGSVVDKELPKKAGIERINVLNFCTGHNNADTLYFVHRAECAR